MRFNLVDFFANLKNFWGLKTPKQAKRKRHFFRQTLETAENIDCLFFLQFNKKFVLECCCTYYSLESLVQQVLQTFVFILRCTFWPKTGLLTAMLCDFVVLRKRNNQVTSQKIFARNMNLLA